MSWVVWWGAYGKFPAQEAVSASWRLSLGLRWGGMSVRDGFYPPTLEVASVSELSVLDLPALGFPTRPIRGSRGMLIRFDWYYGADSKGVRVKQDQDLMSSRGSRVGCSGENICPASDKR